MIGAMNQASVITRFAPSPTGYLHLGHAFSALFAQHQVWTAGGRFLLRLEDIDTVRCRPEFAAAILDDLAWLGLHWDGPVRTQSEHLDDYRSALDHLQGRGLLYPCFCTRKEIAAEIARSGHAPHGPDGVLYPGTCRGLDPGERQHRLDSGQPYALRLDMREAVAQAGPLMWRDLDAGVQIARPEIFGDVVLARKDTPTSYHLAVVWDDALQGITLVTRGNDLFEASHVHRLLQALLALPVPDYRHHALLTDAEGRRYAKRDKALTIASLRQSGHTPIQVQALAGFIPLAT
ncbi:putative Glutamyl-tRNA synthetase [Magnetospirillum gryphiswaldense MSR-1 v2]|uniref:Glutamyl-tRNA synthetase n=2 Tax=Magnetospirillum gryphiswaldense TaxID=55518 RepID=V6F7I7_MAGGM|nr:putative Glutamyl-tRNA synthetase [Magnetospirillum gryphiswaldense MSR-1 v2]